MSSELVEIVGTDLAEKECFCSQLPEYRHDIHMVSSAQNRHNTFYSISLSGQLFMFAAEVVILCVFDATCRADFNKISGIFKFNQLPVFTAEVM